MGGVRRTVFAVALASTVVTVLVATVSTLHFAYRQPELHVGLEEAAALVAVLAAFLVSGRLVRRPGLSELLLTCALVLLALAGVAFAVLASARRGAHTEAVWIARIVSALGAVLFAAAAVAPSERLRRPRRAVALAAAGLALLVGLTAALVAVLGHRLPGGVEVSVVPPSAAWPDLHAPAAVLALHAAAAAAFAVAALGFARRSERRGDEFLAWLAVASVFATFSRVNYLLYPTRYTDWVYTGDLFRLLFYVVLLLATMREISSYWRSLAEAAVLEERRRIARDLHDGLAQELAYIGRNVAGLSAADGDRSERIERLQKAVERAQLESRQALEALSQPTGEPFETVLARAVEEVADRYGVEVELDLASGVRLSAARAESLVRIACEAVANAARHSGAERVALSLDRDGRHVRLRVSDGGRGFDPAAPTAGFGLVSMHDRARATGGRLRIDSAPGRGTTVEVAL
jgi:signal transduction histidine kinase